MEVDGDISLLLDTRTEEGTRQLFGGTNPAATVYLQQSFIDANPITTQRVVNAFTKSLAWIHKASADDVADAVPEEFLLGDRDLYKTAFEKSRAMYSERGLIAEEGFKSLLEMLKTLDPELANANIAFAQTFDPRFVKTEEPAKGACDIWPSEFPGAAGTEIQLTHEADPSNQLCLRTT